jgi:hypothetical protein
MSFAVADGRAPPLPVSLGDFGTTFTGNRLFA